MVFYLQILSSFVLGISSLGNDTSKVKYEVIVQDDNILSCSYEYQLQLICVLAVQDEFLLLTDSIFNF